MGIRGKRNLEKLRKDQEEFEAVSELSQETLNTLLQGHLSDGQGGHPENLSIDEPRHNNLTPCPTPDDQIITAQLLANQFELDLRLARLENLILPLELKLKELAGQSATTPVTDNPELTNFELDDICDEFFFQNPTPAHPTLLEITKKYIESHVGSDEKLILSRVRQWFRLKREAISRKILHRCARVFPPEFPDKPSLLAFRAKINDDSFVKKFAHEIGITCEIGAEFLSFIKQKCLAYLEKHY